MGYRVIYMLSLLLLVGCKAQQQVIRDSVVNQTTSIDSIYIYKVQRDSVYITDSVTIQQMGDTIYKDRLRYIYRDKLRIDTLWREKIRRDTITKVEKAVIKEEQKDWFSLDRKIVLLVVLLGIILILIFSFRKTGS